jgi:phosphatidate cytidylyltransferase
MPETRHQPTTNLQLRWITALVAIPFLLAGLYYTQYGYAIIFSAIPLLCLNEFYTLVAKTGAHPSHRRGMVLASLGLFLIFSHLAWDLPTKFLAICLPQAALIFIDKLFHKNHHNPLQDLALTLFGLVYCVVPFVMLHLATYRSGAYSWQIPIGILLLAWASDTSAFFVGRAWGKHKLFARHSPNKTWEGFSGGFIASLLVAAGLSFTFLELKPIVWILIGILVSVAGTLGDLVESMIKRSLHIKDSGSALPGHGGFLDRFDGLLLALPFVCSSRHAFVS